MNKQCSSLEPSKVEEVRHSSLHITLLEQKQDISGMTMVLYEAHNRQLVGFIV